MRLELKTVLFLNEVLLLRHWLLGYSGDACLLGKCFEMKPVLGFVTETEYGNGNFGLFEYLDLHVNGKY